jgi:hypothetical protein
VTLCWGEASVIKAVTFCVMAHFLAPDVSVPRAYAPLAVKYFAGKITRYQEVSQQEEEPLILA